MDQRTDTITHAVVRPKSAVHHGIAWLGAGGMLLVGWLAPGRGLDNFTIAVLLLLATAAPILIGETLFLRPWERPSAGFRPRGQTNPFDFARLYSKLAGFYGTLGLVYAAYQFFPEYHGGFYAPYYRLLNLFVPHIAWLAMPYFIWVDRHMAEPRDGYWHMGRALFGDFAVVDRNILLHHVLGWIVKAYFLPLIFVWLTGNIGVMLSKPYATAFSPVFFTAYDWWFQFLIFVDVLYGAIGYILTLRIFDSHIRTANASLLGWLVTLQCYPPFDSVLFNLYIHYEDNYFWGNWLQGHDILLVIWGLTILVCAAIYTWGTISFGVRFSNLTHRGIITNGPYRFTKHPAYVFKNIFWWLISVPFISEGGFWMALKNCVALAAVNGIYYLRARTEEKHLSEDPDYVAYALWMNENGMFRRVGGLLPFLRYRPPPAVTGSAGGSIVKPVGAA